MTRFVLDCSVTMAWCFEDEATPGTTRLHRSLAENSTALAPAIWSLEVANVLMTAERTRRITASQVRQTIHFLEALPIEIEPLRPPQVFADILPLARERRLTSYDAAYLELAFREGLPLATLDRQLRKAARAISVALMD